ncbi:MAG: hypothetical protein HFG36_03525 [Eubacterium sp.]|nr:hypothetical protein [Eubacterium sp.]
MKILHLSDFHIRKENRFKYDELCKNINDAIGKASKKYEFELNPEIVLATGDFTETGNADEYKWFKEGFLKLLQLSNFNKVKYVMLVPGNHDFSWSLIETRSDSYVNMCKEIERGLSYIDKENIQEEADSNLIKHIYIEGKEKNLLLIGMNSMKIDSPEKPGLGYFSKEQLRIVGDIISEYKRGNKDIKTQIFVAFHHHLLPVAVVERDTLDDTNKYSITLDARRALNAFLENEVAFAVHGHQHQPSMVTWKDDEQKVENVIHVIAAGCLAGKEYAGEGARNSFMLYSVNDDNVVVYKAQTTNNDSDDYEWDKVNYPDLCVKQMQEKSIPTNQIEQINKKRIITLAEQDDQWIAQVDAMSPLTIKGLVEKLVDSIDQEGAVAYEVNTKKRYRTSTLSTVLECMTDIRLLPEEDLLIMQRKLLRLKDEFNPVDKEIDDIIAKDDEDKPAWGIDEAPSVWTTSKALTALFATKYRPSSEEEGDIAASVEWLANQAYADGGWGYQKYETIEACKSSVPMTAFAMKALGLALQQKYIQNLVNIKEIKSKLVTGLDYLKKMKCERKDEKCVWLYEDNENLSATIWALEAWKIATQVIDNKKAYYSNIYRKISPLALKYVVDKLPEKDDDSWSECFFRANKDDGLKYKKGPLKKDKAFYSFTPYIISYIIKEDESYVENDKILKVMKWVLAHRDDSWLIKENYNSNNACTITVAMAINVIVNWLKVRSNSLLEKDLEAILS